MMKKILLTIVSACTLLGFAGCDFLDVYPDDKMLYEQIAGDEAAINNVLNGVYLNMANNELYGSNLSITTIECLAQQYNVSSDNATYDRVRRYQQEEQAWKSTFSTIWQQMYVQILTINDFMKLVENATVPLSEDHKKLLLGEAHALRAFHHFDLLRLFGPVYNSSDSTMVSIPYNDRGDGQLLQRLRACDVIDKILADLKTAENYLQNDPIKTDGRLVKQTGLDPIANFRTNRHYRMNYYAVKSLQARVWLWRENRPEALAAAKIVLDAPAVKAGKMFGWLPSSNIISGSSPDRIFSSEVIFGIRNQNMYTSFDSHFDGNLQYKALLRPLPARLTAVYEDDGNDYRFYKVWQLPGGDEPNKTFFKYARPADFTVADTTFAYFQPLIRKSELYYIVAECEPVPAVGADSLAKVRISRGIQTPEVQPAALADAIEKEYQKEFYGEGQLFYFYKRKNRTSLVDGNTGGAVTPIYMIPLPEAELEAHARTDE